MCSHATMVLGSRTVGYPGNVFAKKLGCQTVCHDFRRSAARNLRRAGVAESVVMAVGGWKTAAMFVVTRLSATLTSARRWKNSNSNGPRPAAISATIQRFRSKHSLKSKLESELNAYSGQSYGLSELCR